jgi:hypothetical protein
MRLPGQPGEHEQPAEHGDPRDAPGDAVAERGQIKGELEGAAFADIGIHGAAGQTLACRALIGAAEHLAAGH